VSGFERIQMAPTKEEHDAVVARKGRPYTDNGMRHARQIDDDSASAPMTALDGVIADSRRALGLSK